MEFIEDRLTYEEYCELRSSVGWNNWFEGQTRRSIENSLHIVTLREGELLLGMGRLIGDGMYFLICDVIVRAEYQGQGLGSQIVEHMVAYVEAQTPEGGRSSIQLIAEPGKDAFYIKRGFKLIPHEYCGSGMRKVIRR